MIDIFITFLTFVLIVVCLFMMLVILMQRASANAGLGSAFGGGAAESAFGADTTNVLVKATKWSAFAFFGISLVLYILYMVSTKEKANAGEEVLPDIPVETVPATQEGTAPGGGEMTAPATEETTTPPEGTVPAEPETPPNP